MYNASVMLERFIPKTPGEITVAAGVILEAGAVIASVGLHAISGDQAAVVEALEIILVGAGFVRVSREIVAQQEPQFHLRSATELQFYRQYGDHYRAY